VCHHQNERKKLQKKLKLLQTNQQPLLQAAQAVQQPLAAEEALKAEIDELQTKLSTIPDCLFRLYASCPKGKPGTQLMVKKLQQHTCPPNQQSAAKSGQRKAAVNLNRAAACLVKATAGGMQKLSGNVAKGMLETVFGGQFTKGFAGNAAKMAFDSVAGHPVLSFLQLMPWIETLLKEDPLTVVRVGTAPMDYTGTAFVGAQTRLGRGQQPVDPSKDRLPQLSVSSIFVAPGSSRRGAVHLTSHVFATDGGHGKSYMGGTLLTLVGYDANNQLFPLAFFWGPAEDTATCTTFFKEVCKVYPFLAKPAPSSSSSSSAF